MIVGGGAAALFRVLSEYEPSAVRVTVEGRCRVDNGGILRPDRGVEPENRVKRGQLRRRVAVVPVEPRPAGVVG